jgi:hypothetical protein
MLHNRKKVQKRQRQQECLKNMKILFYEKFLTEVHIVISVVFALNMANDIKIKFVPPAPSRLCFITYDTTTFATQHQMGC